MKLEATKYEGAGNDFILIDDRRGTSTLSPAGIAALCDRRRGIGADGLMLLCADRQADCRMRFFNSDGSRAAMCGNGARCFALFARHCGVCRDTLRFIADDGVHTATIAPTGDHSAEVCISMTDVCGIRSLDCGRLLDTGVPHLVVTAEQLDPIDVVSAGGNLRRIFDANVDFVSIDGTGRISIRTYERGVEGETLACGTGAVAGALAVCQAAQPDQRRFEVNAAGGRLQVEFERCGADTFRNIRLSGPARRIFTTEILTELFQNEKSGCSVSTLQKNS